MAKAGFSILACSSASGFIVLLRPPLGAYGALWELFPCVVPGLALARMRELAY